MTRVDEQHYVFCSVLFYLVSVTENNYTKYLFQKNVREPNNKIVNGIFSRILQPDCRAPASFSDTSGRSQPRQEEQRLPSLSPAPNSLRPISLCMQPEGSKRVLRKRQEEKRANLFRVLFTAVQSFTLSSTTALISSEP